MKKIFETPSTGNYFFGYYDKSPLNLDNTLLLACKSNFIDRAVTSSDQLEIGYFKYQESNKFIKVATTRAWNWQQGCMLQWVMNGSGKKIIFNDIVDNKFVSIILNIDTKERQILPMSYYTMSSGGDFVLCIDNERHAFYRPNYSYKGIDNLSKKHPCPDDDGIWFISIKTNETRQIISLKQILAIKPLSNMEGAIHYLEHLMINPNDKRFMFLHRWKINDGSVYSRLYTADTDGHDIYLLNDSGRVSHSCWKNNNEIISWSGLTNAINFLRKYKKIVKYTIKPLLPYYKKISGGGSVEGGSKLSQFVTGDSYINFKDKTKVKTRLKFGELQKDGHPSFSKVNGNLLLTDTYPIKSNKNKQELILFDLKSKSILAKKYLSHDKYSQSPMRCDLHPKWSHDGKMISIDTIDNDYRSIYVYET
jgi:hypothetical protein